MNRWDSEKNGRLLGVPRASGDEPRLAQAYGIKIESKRGGNRGNGPNEANRKATAERGRKHRQQLARQAWPMIEAGDSMNTITRALGCSKATLARAIEEHSEA